MSEKEQKKKEQERRVGELLQLAYEQNIGFRLEGNEEGGDPPDRLFYYQGQIIGVEMFELSPYHDDFAFFSDLTDSIDSEFDQRKICEHYKGLVITLGILADTKIRGTVKYVQRKRGIGKNPEHRIAKELVELFISRVPSHDSVPEDGLFVAVNPNKYCALSALAAHFSVNRCSLTYSRRADGKAAPVVILSPGHVIYDELLERNIEATMTGKIEKKYRHEDKWQHIGHSILVAHDFPRNMPYQTFMMEWDKYLESVSARIDILEAFDELWLVTMQDYRVAIEDRPCTTQRICGHDIKP